MQPRLYTRGESWRRVVRALLLTLAAACAGINASLSALDFGLGTPGLVTTVAWGAIAVFALFIAASVAVAIGVVWGVYGASMAESAAAQVQLQIASVASAERLAARLKLGIPDDEPVRRRDDSGATVAPSVVAFRTRTSIGGDSIDPPQDARSRAVSVAWIWAGLGRGSASLEPGGLLQTRPRSLTRVPQGRSPTHAAALLRSSPLAPAFPVLQPSSLDPGAAVAPLPPQLSLGLERLRGQLLVEPADAPAEAPTVARGAEDSVVGASTAPSARAPFKLPPLTSDRRPRQSCALVASPGAVDGAGARWDAAVLSPSGVAASAGTPPAPSLPPMALLVAASKRARITPLPGSRVLQLGPADGSRATVSFGLTSPRHPPEAAEAVHPSTLPQSSPQKAVVSPEREKAERYSVAGSPPASVGAGAAKRFRWEAPVASPQGAQTATAELRVPLRRDQLLPPLALHPHEPQHPLLQPQPVSVRHAGGVHGSALGTHDIPRHLATPRPVDVADAVASVSTAATATQLNDSARSEGAASPPVACGWTAPPDDAPHISASTTEPQASPARGAVVNGEPLSYHDGTAAVPASSPHPPSPRLARDTVAASTSLRGASAQRPCLSSGRAAAQITAPRRAAGGAGLPPPAQLHASTPPVPLHPSWGPPPSRLLRDLPELASWPPALPMMGGQAWALDGASSDEERPAPAQRGPLPWLAAADCTAAAGAISSPSTPRLRSSQPPAPLLVQGLRRIATASGAARAISRGASRARVVPPLAAAGTLLESASDSRSRPEPLAGEGGGAATAVEGALSARSLASRQLLRRGMRFAASSRGGASAAVAQQSSTLLGDDWDPAGAATTPPASVPQRGGDYDDGDEPDPHRPPSGAPSRAAAAAAAAAGGGTVAVPPLLLRPLSRVRGFAVAGAPPGPFAAAASPPVGSHRFA